MEAVKLRIGELAKTGSFGPGKFVRVKSTSDEDKGMQFMSQLFFLSVEMESAHKIEEIPIVVKTQVAAEERDAMGTHTQFYKEVNFYDKVLPLFGSLGLKLCPKLYYGLATNGADSDQDLVVLEDLRASGFKLAKELFLDYDHVVITMKKLGELHGLSYKLKKATPSKLRDLEKILYSDPYNDYDNGGMAGAMLRGFQPVIEENPGVEVLETAYRKMTTGSLTKQWEKTRKPEEPYAVIAHGDFNKNNLMYGYDNGKVCDVKFFDFGTAAYSDPAVDISFFLYVNTTSESREQHWDEYLEAYWEGVVSVEKDPGFTFEQFLKQFAKRAIWGYFPCCFYLPMLMFPDEMPENFKDLSNDEWKDLGMKLGGKEGETAVADIVRHLHKRGYLKEYVDHFNLC